MEASELRIGNFVHRSHTNGALELIEVETIGVDGINFYCLSDYDSYSIEYMPTFKDIKPIPLTEDWSIKFGYECIQEMLCDFDEKAWDYVGIRFELYNDIGYDFCTKMKVHEWQNFWKANTGEELLIK